MEGEEDIIFTRRSVPVSGLKWHNFTLGYAVVDAGRVCGSENQRGWERTVGVQEGGLGEDAGTAEVSVAVFHLLCGFIANRKGVYLL